MESLQQYSKKQGYRTGQYASIRFILDVPEAKKIFLKVAKEAEELYISDTAAAEYLTETYEIFSHLNYNTVRRYFRDYRNGKIK
jgi:hypothetical protein